MSRPEFSSLNESPDVSVLIIGAGINGVGLFRELALQGVDVLLVDKSDFCSGTSAAATRVIHGGLRYLENGELRLVRESIRERTRLLKNAPHYVKPLPTTIPIESWSSGLIAAAGNLLGFSDKPGRRGALLVKSGLTLYDFLAGPDSMLPKHEFRSGSMARTLRPFLKKDAICTATYYDARITYPERLCLELVLDGEALSAPARALNYVRVEAASGRNVVLRDEISGETLPVRPRIVVNASGAWIDRTNRDLGCESRFIGGTKGSHVVLDNPELLAATRGEMIYFPNRDGRICIFYPFYDKIIAGATDIPTDDPEEICSAAEVAYILDSVRQVFPGIPIEEEQVVFRFCGVRPLPRQNAAHPGRITRDHSFPLLPADSDTQFPVYSLVGGKWTTFRAFAQQVTDEILPVLGRERVRDSAELSIGGGTDYPNTSQARDSWCNGLHQGTGLPLGRLASLLERYGTRASEVAAYTREGPDVDLEHQPSYSRREIEFIARRERVVHLDDLILRRTLIGLLGQTNRGLLEELAAVVAPSLEWPESRAAEEVDRTVALLQQVHGVPAHRFNP